MKLYRIYTTDRQRDNLLAMVAKTLQSFTAIPCIGYWRGTVERSLIIEHAAPDTGTDFIDWQKWLQLAGDIKELQRDEAVGVLWPTGEFEIY